MHGHMFLDSDEKSNVGFYDKTLMSRLIKFLGPHKNKLILALGLMLFQSISMVVPPYLQKIAVDRYILPPDAPGNIVGLTIIALTYIGISIFNWFVAYGQSYVLVWMGQNVIFDISIKLFKHIQTLSLEFFDRHETGKIISRLVNDVQALNELLTHGITGIIRDFVTMIGIMVFMLNMNVKLSLLSFTLIPPLFALALLFRKRGRAAFREVRKKIANVTAKLEEGISGVRVVKSFSRENTNIQDFDKTNVENLSANMQAVKVWSFYNSIIEVLTAVGICIVIWGGGIQVMGESLTRGELLAFLSYVRMLYFPVRQLSQIYTTMQSAMAASERIFEVMDTKPKVIESPNAIELPPIVGHVKYNNVSFGYEEDKYVLKDITFEAEPGQTIAIVGPTGAGKSTIVNLLVRLYDPQKGEITIDGYDIKNVTLKSLRSQMGMVLQDSFLFSGSVKENIRYGKLDASEKEIIQAAETVNAHKFISQLPAGYDTEVGERGTKLSVGQRQLVSFARALLANPKILILDEATSSVDAYTEMLIQKALEELLKNRTSFVIAHRLSTIINADKVLVIENGQIVESGTHLELLQIGGLYQKLYNMQFASVSASV